MAGYTPESRNAAFQGGQNGTGTHMATSLQTTSPIQFSEGGLLSLPNMLKTANGQATDTYRLRNSQDNYLRSQMKAGGAPGTMYMNV